MKIRRISCCAFAAVWLAAAGWAMNGRGPAGIHDIQARNFLVNDDTLGGCSQSFPAVAGDGRGGFVMAWADQRGGHYGSWGGNYFYRGNDVYIQRFDAGGGPLGPNRKVNDGAGNLARDSKHSVSIAANRSGRFVIAWEDVRGNPELNQDIFFQLFDAEGNALGPNRKANEDDTDFTQITPAVTMDEEGGFIIVWEQYDENYGNQAILFRRFDPEGNPVSGDQEADDGEGRLSLGSGGPSIAMDGSGRFAIAWIGRIDDGWTPDVCFQRFDASAHPIGPNRTANDTTVWAGQESPSIGVNGQGDLVIAWLDARNHFGEDVDYYDVYFQRFDSSGQAAGDNRMAGGGGGQYHPAAVMGKNGEVTVAWHDDRTGRQQFDVVYQQYDAEGRALGGIVKTGETDENSSQTAPNLVIDDAGGIVIVWEDDLNGKLNLDVRYQRFDAAGGAREPSRRANDDAGSTDQTHPAAAVAGNGGFIVTWTDERNAFMYPYLTYDIYFQQYDAEGNPMGPNRQVNDNDSRISDSTAPAVAADANGNFVIAWTDNRVHSWDIYCQRYDASGQAVGLNEWVNAGDDYHSNQRSPAVAMNSRGDFVIAWMSSRGWDHGVCYQLFDADGHRVDSVQEPYYGNGGDWPAAAMDDEGRFAIAWYINAYNDIQGVVTILSEVYVERFDAEGNSIGLSQKANDAVNAPRGGPSIAMNRSGDFVVAWQDGRNGGHDVFFQRYDADGRMLGTNQKADDEAGIAAPYPPAVAIDETGRFAVAWSDGRMGAESSILMGQGFNSDGSRNGDNFRISDGPSSCIPSAASNAEKILFTWQDNRRSKGFDVYAASTTWEDASAVSDRPVIPRDPVLMPNYPNPFNPETVISYSLSEAGRVRLSIFDLAGRQVRDLVDDRSSAGFHKVVWDGTDSENRRMTSGVYLCRMIVESGGNIRSFTRKICLVR